MPTNGGVGLLRTHLAAVAVVVAALAVTGAVLAFARPQANPSRLPKPPGDGLSYTRVLYTRADARRAFAAAGIALVQGPVSGGVADLHTADAAVEVSVFGDRRTVDASGFSDYYTVVAGRSALAPSTCTGGARDAERRRRNVRAIVRCGPGAAAELRRVSRALARL